MFYDKQKKTSETCLRESTFVLQILNKHVM